VPEEPARIDPALLWKEQPAEQAAVVRPGATIRRSESLYAESRSEILGSLCAATLFVVVIGGRLASSHDLRLWSALAVIAGWVLITAWRSRKVILAREERPPDGLAVSGLEYYHGQLMRRREHLKSAWLWHGPLVLACTTLLLVVARSMGVTLVRFLGIAPLLIVLVAWVAVRNLRRWRQIREIEQEIREVEEIQSSNRGTAQ
jgi:hypothetical protein